VSRIVEYWSNPRKLVLHDNNGEIQRFDFDPDSIEDLMYDVAVAPGSSAGVDKDVINSWAFRLHERGVIDNEGLVESLEGLPFKASLLKKVRESNEQTAMLEQLAAENEELKLMLQQVQGAQPEQPPQPAAPVRAV